MFPFSSVGAVYLGTFTATKTINISDKVKATNLSENNFLCLLTAGFNVPGGNTATDHGISISAGSSSIIVIDSETIRVNVTKGHVLSMDSGASFGTVNTSVRVYYVGTIS